MLRQAGEIRNRTFNNLELLWYRNYCQSKYNGILFWKNDFNYNLAKYD